MNQTVEVNGVDSNPMQANDAFPKDQITNTQLVKGMYDYSQAEFKSTESKSVVENSRINQLLHRFQTVFEEPSMLPPTRIDNHQINLLDDAKIPPWRPIQQLNRFELEALKT